jgi:hypothetical protein
MKNIFILGMCTTQLSESFNRGLKAFLKSDLDVVRFFHHFERVLNQKCEREIESVYYEEKTTQIEGECSILQQASRIYTPKIFEIFQSEWEISIAAYVKSKTIGQLNTKYHILVQGLITVFISIIAS